MALGTRERRPSLFAINLCLKSVNKAHRHLNAVCALPRPTLLLVLPDRTDYFEASFANARSVVDPSIADQALWLYEVGTAQQC